MTRGEAIAKANWWSHEIGKNVYIMHRKDIDYSQDAGYFVLTEDDDVRDHMRYATVDQYCNARLNELNVDIYDNDRMGVGHS